MQSKWIKVVCFLSALLFLTAYAQPDEESDSQKLPTPLEQIKKLLPSVSYEMLGEFPCLVYSNTSSGRATIYRVINPIFTGDQVSVLKLELDQESKKLRIEKRTISQDDFADMQKDPILTVLKEVYPESKDFSYRISGIESLEKLAAVEIVINIDGHEESKRMLFQEDLPHLYFGLVNFGTVEVVEETNLKNIHSDCALLINPDAMTLVMRVFYKKLIELAGEENNSVQKQVEDFLITMFLDELVRRFNADPEKKDLDEAIRQEIFKQFKEFVTEEVKELVRHQKKH